jgi:hypothetical protein
MIVGHFSVTVLTFRGLMVKKYVYMGLQWQTQHLTQENRKLPALKVLTE